MKILAAFTLALVISATAGAQSAAPVKPTVFLAGTGNTQTTYARGLFGSVNSSTSQHDETMEMAADFTTDCPGVTLTIKQDSANYSVALNVERARHNQLIIAGQDGTVLYTDMKTANILVGRVSGTTVKAKVAKACEFITGKWASKAITAPEPAPKPVPQEAPAPVAPAAQPAPAVAPVAAPTTPNQPESLGDLARRLKAEKAARQ